jgi:hypothetical protein
VHGDKTYNTFCLWKQHIDLLLQIIINLYIIYYILCSNKSMWCLHKQKVSYLVLAPLYQTFVTIHTTCLGRLSAEAELIVPQLLAILFFDGRHTILGHVMQSVAFESHISEIFL